MEKRVVSQLLLCIDNLAQNVFIIAATSRPDSLDQSLRRSGRFDKEIQLIVPDEGVREEMLHCLLKSIPLHEEIQAKDLAKKTPGYVASDIKALVSEAGV